MKIGYARVSTAAQNIDMQIEALNKEGCNIIYQEKKSGLSVRNELENAVKSLRAGDTLYVWAFDWLGRNMLDVMSNVKTIHDKGANVYSISQKIDTGTPAGKMMLANFSMFAEMEATLRKERAAAGIAIAREQGRPLGRERGLTKRTKEIAPVVRQMYLSKEPRYSVKDISDTLKIPFRTIYACLDYTKTIRRGEPDCLGGSGGSDGGQKND